jgi:hypothetical protein
MSDTTHQPSSITLTCENIKHGRAGACRNEFWLARELAHPDWTIRHRRSNHGVIEYLDPAPPQLPAATAASRQTTILPVKNHEPNRHLSKTPVQPAPFRSHWKAICAYGCARSNWPNWWSPANAP